MKYKLYQVDALNVSRKSSWLTLDFPVDEFQHIAITDEIISCFDKKPLEAYKGKTEHTTLTPYWAQKLNKTELTAIQLSERKGYLQCKLSGSRVEISEQAKLYLEGEIFVE